MNPYNIESAIISVSIAQLIALIIGAFKLFGVVRLIGKYEQRFLSAEKDIEELRKQVKEVNRLQNPIESMTDKLEKLDKDIEKLSKYTLRIAQLVYIDMSQRGVKAPANLLNPNFPDE